MSKFTPGPWEAFVSADAASVVKNKQGLGIARVVDDYDAYLIAAAPAMYEALQKCADFAAKTGSEPDVLIVIMQQIAKISEAALRAADGGE